MRPVGRVFSHTTCLARTRSRSTHLRSTRPHRSRSLAHVRKSEAAHTLALDAPALDAVLGVLDARRSRDARWLRHAHDGFVVHGSARGAKRSTISRRAATLSRRTAVSWRQWPRTARARRACARVDHVVHAPRSLEHVRVMAACSSHLHTCASQKPRIRSRSTHPRST